MNLPNLFGLIFIMSGSMLVQAKEITIATFNVSMEAENYVAQGSALSPQVLSGLLKQANHSQIKNIAAIIQQVQPDILLLNEFDYIENPQEGIELFIKNYLAVSQLGGKPLNYPYFFYKTVNTGQPSGFDLNRDGKIDGPEDAWGFGNYPGQYGMVILSRFPLDEANTRTFQHFKWQDMPNRQIPKQANGQPWFDEQVMAKMPLSSKSHWDVPVMIGKHRLHLLASHPTPPVFDGPENRNGHRNHDEVRFWVDYLDSKTNYHYDDQGRTGGYAADAPFIVMGDLNSSAVEGDAHRDAISRLINHPKIQSEPMPASIGGHENMPNNLHAKFHTAFWKMRADYVLPSKQGLKVLDTGVFWPAKSSPLYSLVATRKASSDHRLVWIKVELTN